MTSEHSRRQTPTNGESMSSAAGSPARGFHEPITRLPASMMRAPVFGWSLTEWFALFDRDTSSWRTRQSLLIGDWKESLGTLPLGGSMRNGRLYRPLAWERPTHGNESSLWPTPTVSQDAKRIRPQCPSERTGRHGTMLVGAIGTAAPQFIGWYVNPTFCEWLMGFPIGWTALGDSATPSSRKSPSGSAAD